MIPVELDKPSWRRKNFDAENNDNNLLASLDFMHEVCEDARIWEEAAKLRAARRYNTRVCERTF